MNAIKSISYIFKRVNSHKMKISAKIENSLYEHKAYVKTHNSIRELAIPGKSSGFGSAVNGGELLFLAMATCFCNDVYREANKQNIRISKVIVEASGEFGEVGSPGFNIGYQAKIEGDASDEKLIELINHTDKVSEIQNTLRSGVNVVLNL